MTKTLTKLYDNYSDAAGAVGELERIGVPRDDISIVAHQSGHSEAAEDAGKGAGAGAVIGGVGGLLAGLGVLAIPGLGPVVAAGWLAATAVGAGGGAIVGGAIGGVVGAMQKEGVSEDDAHVYAEGVRRGGTLVSAKVSNDLAPQAEAILDRYRAVDPTERGRFYRDVGWSRFDETAAPYTPEQIAEERDRLRRTDRVL
ncbi:hypothetical protein ACFB49_08400 [Sphingomonas sp. DBB INV C78]|uniref:general stress protein n=1 Tax=Sphingomonas sp. DBB INV C78 TaxID=3349434 RepID=UPI0036D3A8CE